MIVNLIIILSLFSCEKQDILKGTPGCIEIRINKITSDPVWNPPAKVYSYEYDGQTVYYFSAGCCDIMSSLYDESCNLICCGDQCYLPNYFDKLIETSQISFLETWV